MAALIAAVGWYRAQNARRVSLPDLSVEDRHRLVEEFFAVSTKAYTPAWFEPAVGYTLRSNAAIKAWGSKFTSNELGYRTGPVAKAEGTFRVVFVGDSWTYGMGADEEVSFPRQFQRLAGELVPGKHVEAWTLALPGYNTFNEVAALEVFLDRLQPDAVVLCPTANDTNTSATILPNGSTKRAVGRISDPFGSDHSLIYKVRFLDSFRYRTRWRVAFGEMRRLEILLERQEIPFLLFFPARWNPVFVHHMIAGAGIQSPYVITPALTGNKWFARGLWGHGTAECYRLYAAWVERGLAGLLGWPEAARREGEPRELSFPGPPAANDLSPLEPVLASYTRKYLKTRFLPTGSHRDACVGPMDCTTGLMGRATTVLLRRARRASNLVITVRRLEDTSGLYPLELTASVPTASGGTTATTIVSVKQPLRTELLLEIPPEIPVGSGMDVEIRADRVVVARDALALRSVIIESIEQRP